MAITIKSDELIPIEDSFKVSAGPGAGKTHWLISHIGNVLAHSKRLGSVKKVACITYTNVGTDTILSRLGYVNECVEVSTIHGFLYANVVKPYAYLLAEDTGLKPESMVVIDDSIFRSPGVVAILLNKIEKTWIDNNNFLDGLKDSCWHYENHRFTDFKPRHPRKINQKKNAKFIANSVYMSFKHFLWSGGYVAFEDILYLSWLLFDRYPNLYNLLKAKFPYFFIDEFQDTVPFVVDFLKRMGDCGTTIGVVGDKAQSIYEFIGATAKQFDDFTIPYMKEYEIHGNRRSSKQIIELLNKVRKDFPQHHLSNIESERPLLLVGDMLACYQRSIDLCQSDDIHSLAYPNITANSMRNKNGVTNDENILDEDFDSNASRLAYVKTLIRALEFARMHDLRSAWQQLDIIDRDRSRTIILLRKLLDGYEMFAKGSLMDFYQFLVSELNLNLTSFKAGEIKTFYESHLYAMAALGVKCGDSDSMHKTIHKSKGEEFDNVFVVLGGEKDLSFLLTPNLNSNNTHRVYYVAISRAIKRLFITVPTLSADNESALADLPLEIERVSSE